MHEQRRRSGTPRLSSALVLDDSDPLAADLSLQNETIATLHAIGVNVLELLASLEDLPSRRTLIRERRAAASEAHWRVLEPFCGELSAAFARLERRAQRRGLTVPLDVFQAFEELYSAAERRGTPLAAAAIADQARQAGERAKDGRAGLSVAPTASAIRARWMPGLALDLVFPAIHRALQNAFTLPRHRGRKLTDRDDVEARRLTVDVLKAFFPEWGVTLTPEKLWEAHRRRLKSGSVPSARRR